MQQARPERQQQPWTVDLSVFASEEAFWPCNFADLPSSWHEHVPLAYWMVQALRPTCFVELGTHYGLSYFSFCEAVDRLGLTTSAYAIDTWQGDEHAGYYGDEVYFKLIELHDPRFSRFSRLVRSTFDDACGQFADGSIDLLHIDGLHTYEAVKHDFETWRPKLASPAIVLFHDTNVRERGFGVWKLWQQLAGCHPHFEFLHGHGLGVLGIGSGFPNRVGALFAAGVDPRVGQQVRNVFARLGALVSQQARVRHAITHLGAELGSRDARITELSNRIVDRDALIQELRAQAVNLTASIAALKRQLDAEQAVCGEARAQAAAHAARIGAMKKSLFWRLTRPLRRRLRRQK